MVPAPDTEFLLRLETNEMVERERFTALLAAIEDVVRRHRFGGPEAYLLVGAVRRGSIEVAIAIGGLITTIALMLPSFLVDLKKLSGDGRAEPNPFAVALADVMAFDGTSRVDLVHKEKVVTIRRSEVPFVQKIAFGHAIRAERQRAIRPEELRMNEEPMPEGGQVEDEDQDWVETLEASDHPPREVRAGPAGYVTSLTLVGEFEAARGRDGSAETRFVPRDTTLAPYFTVAGDAYGAGCEQGVQYEVTGNVSIDGDGPGTIEVLHVMPPGDALLTLRT